jgi:tetratricopeptide (TPR) repeat protein
VMRTIARPATGAALLLGVCLVSARVTCAAFPDDCAALRKHGRSVEAHACYQSLTREGSAYLRGEGYWGLEMYNEANNEFRQAVAQSDQNANYRVRWGRLLHERFNDTDAANLFKEALVIDPKNAQACLGLALVSADGFDNQAILWTDKALAIDPKLVEAHELKANLALEDSDQAVATAEADRALTISPEAVEAMAIHASIEILADRSPDVWLDKIHTVNPAYGDGYALVARHLVLNRRYEDGVAYYRKALEADPKLWSARAELAINLMRLGQEEEPRKQLEMCYDNGYRNEATVNSLRLLDSYKNFVIYRDQDTILKLHAKEAELLYPYVLAELKRAIADYEEKYKMKLPGPVQVELYPDHEDFAVRTLGMPGLGALGVTFGEVVAMDSPSARKPGDFSWASTLRHEMSHVFILTATDHRVPRWFTEGLAVHEETEASPEWGDRITPDIIVAIRDKQLLPVADLDRGFVRPEYPSQVIVSYYQAGRICDYIQSRWGADKLLDIVHSFARRKTTPQAIEENLGMPTEQFDREFLAWLDQDVGATVANFDGWRTALKDLIALDRNKQYDEVVKKGEEVRRLYPDYVYEGNAYEFLAEAHLAKDNKPGAVAALTAYEKRGGRDPDTLKELASLEEAQGDLAEAAATLDRINAIDPMNEEDLHRHLGDLWFAQNNYSGAIREYGAVIASHPQDRASAQLQLARAYLASGRRDKAEENVLRALEAAPDYRPAQQLLLQLQDTRK